VRYAIVASFTVPGASFHQLSFLACCRPPERVQL